MDGRTDGRTEGGDCITYRITAMGGYTIGARVSLPWQRTRLMRNVIEDGCTRCVAGWMPHRVLLNEQEFYWQCRLLSATLVI